MHLCPIFILIQKLMHLDVFIQTHCVFGRQAGAIWGALFAGMEWEGTILMTWCQVSKVAVWFKLKINFIFLTPFYFYLNLS